MAQGDQEQPLPRRWRGQARPPTAQLAHDDMTNDRDNTPTTNNTQQQPQKTLTMSQPAKQGQSQTTAHCSAPGFFSLLPAIFVTCSLCTLLSLVSARPFSTPHEKWTPAPRYWASLGLGNLLGDPRAQHRPCPRACCARLQAAACTSPLCSLGPGLPEHSEQTNKTTYK